MSASVFVQAQCCETFKVYSNTRLPDVTSVTNYIHAGNYSFNPGDVNVVAGENITFIAGNEITLDPGFTVHDGAVFTAELGPCTSAPLAVYPAVNLRACHHTLSAILCNPNNIPVSYLWSTGSQGSSIDVSPSGPTPYWVKVTNLQTGKVIEKHFMISPDYFGSDPTVLHWPGDYGPMYPSFSPDGDGFQDTWYPRIDYDATNDHIRRKAYKRLIHY